MKNRHGDERTFGHFVVRNAEGVRFPGGWTGGHYLDFPAAGNARLDPGRFGFCPMMAVNEGSVDLILGWEVLKFGDTFAPLRDYWLLEREGPLENIVPTPCPSGSSVEPRSHELRRGRCTWGGPWAQRLHHRSLKRDRRATRSTVREAWHKPRAPRA